MYGWAGGKKKDYIYFFYLSQLSKDDINIGIVG
jgi:hypothetical protein